MAFFALITSDMKERKVVNFRASFNKELYIQLGKGRCINFKEHDCEIVNKKEGSPGVRVLPGSSATKLSFFKPAIAIGDDCLDFQTDYVNDNNENGGTYSGNKSRLTGVEGEGPG